LDVKAPPGTPPPPARWAYRVRELNRAVVDPRQRLPESHRPVVAGGGQHHRLRVGAGNQIQRGLERNDDGKFESTPRLVRNALLLRVCCFSFFSPRSTYPPLRSLFLPSPLPRYRAHNLRVPCHQRRQLPASRGRPCTVFLTLRATQSDALPPFPLLGRLSSAFYSCSALAAVLERAPRRRCPQPLRRRAVLHCCSSAALPHAMQPLRRPAYPLSLLLLLPSFVGPSSPSFFAVSSAYALIVVRRCAACRPPDRSMNYVIGTDGPGRRFGVVCRRLKVQT